MRRPAPNPGGDRRAPGGPGSARRSGGPGPVEQVLDEVEQPESAHCRSSNTITTGRCRPAARRKPPGREQVLAGPPAARSSRPSRWASRGSTYARSSGSGTCSRSRPRASRRLAASSPRRSRAHPHHLGQGPERDTVAVGEAAAPVPPGRSSASPSMYFSNSQASRDFPTPPTPVTDTRCAPPSSPDAWKQLLDQPELAVTADERRLDRSAAPPPSWQDPVGPPQGDRVGLALQPWRRRVKSTPPRPPARSPRPPARLRGRPRPARWRGVHQVARDHPSPVAPTVTAAAPVDSGPGAKDAVPSASAERSTASMSSSAARTARSASSSFARRAPDRHHRVTDELLDAPPYRAITFRETVEVGRESRSSGPLPAFTRASERVVKPTRSANSTETRRRSSGGGASRVRPPVAVDRGIGDAGAPAGVPHSPQNRCPGGFEAPHDGQFAASAVPQLPQNRCPGGFS